MARNKSRTSAPKVEQDATPPAPATATSQTQEFSWSNPTEFVDLPSGGKYYPEGHPLHGQDAVEIRFMTAKEEDILTSQALIRKGIVLDRLVDSVIVDKRITSNALLIGDKNAILIAARVTGYGEEYNVKITCPACGEDSEEEFMVSDIMTVKTADASEIVWNDDGTFDIQLPMTKATVSCRLMTGADETANAQRRKQMKKHRMANNELTTMLRTMVVKINGNSDRAMINSFVENMPARDARHLRINYTKAVPNVELNTDFDCGNCGHSADMEVPLNAGFFWPDA